MTLGDYRDPFEPLDTPDTDLSACGWFRTRGLPDSARQICSFGCRDEPRCETEEPPEGWPGARAADRLPQQWDDLAQIDTPVTRGDLAAILAAGTPRGSELLHGVPVGTSVDRMLDVISQMTGVTIDDMLAAVDLARATSPAPDDPDVIPPVNTHPYVPGPAGFTDICHQETTAGRCALAKSAPVHQLPKAAEKKPDRRITDSKLVPNLGKAKTHSAAANLINAALEWTSHYTRDQIEGAACLALWDAAEAYRKASR